MDDDFSDLLEFIPPFPIELLKLLRFFLLLDSVFERAHLDSQTVSILLCFSFLILFHVFLMGGLALMNLMFWSTCSLPFLLSCTASIGIGQRQWGDYSFTFAVDSVLGEVITGKASEV